jgi:hypothetical protein
MFPSEVKLRSLVLIGVLILGIILLHFVFPLNLAIIVGDGDERFYFDQLTSLINHNITNLDYPVFRALHTIVSMKFSSIFSISVKNAMRWLSALYFSGFIGAILYAYFKSGRFLLPLVIWLTMPVTCLYFATFYPEMPARVMLLLSFLTWDKYCRTGVRKWFVFTIFFCILGLLNKESFLIQIPIMGLYSLIFFPRRFINWGSILFISGLVYWLNYTYLFQFFLPYVSPSSLASISGENALSIWDSKLFDYSRYIRFFLSPFSSGSIVHLLINFMNAFGASVVVLLFMIIKFFSRKDLLYFVLLTLIMVVVSITAGMGMKYIYLVFGPSFFLFSSKYFTAVAFDKILKYALFAFIVLTLISANYSYFKIHHPPASNQTDLTQTGF